MKNLLLVTVCLAFAIFSCGDSATPSPAESPELSLPEPGAPRGRPIPNAAPEVDEVLYPWVDRLNMRDSPGAGAGKVIAKLERRQPLTFTGEKSPRPETVVLRGLAFSEHWLKVSTKEGKEGWVHGGAVRPEGVKKGHPPISDKKFDFPAFGRFDLNSWTATEPVTEEGGDAEIITQTFRRDDQQLEIISTELGDYGYGWTYRLSDDRGNLQKVREFTFATDPFRLEESVVDYLATIPVRYSRTQELDQHYRQLNARPRMARGEWTITELTE